jgi:hypothetical protein
MVRLAVHVVGSMGVCSAQIRPLQRIYGVNTGWPHMQSQWVDATSGLESMGWDACVRLGGAHSALSPNP